MSNLQEQETAGFGCLVFMLMLAFVAGAIFGGLAATGALG